MAVSRMRAWRSAAAIDVAAEAATVDAFACLSNAGGAFLGGGTDFAADGSGGGIRIGAECFGGKFTGRGG